MSSNDTFHFDRSYQRLRALYLRGRALELVDEADLNCWEAEVACDKSTARLAATANELHRAHALAR